MNCRRAQERINWALASGEPAFPGELEQHLQDCAGCRAFFASEASLFGSIDSHLRRIANEPVPPSLLPGVRVRLQEESSPRPHWIPRWGFAAMGALVVLIVAASIQMRHSDTTDHATDIAAQVVPTSPSANRSRPADGQVQVKTTRPAQTRVIRKVSVPEHSSTPEVLILPEEQEAFRLFVTEISKGQDCAIALTSAALESGDASVEIALLTIKSVEVKPLEGTDSE